MRKEFPSYKELSESACPCVRGGSEALACESNHEIWLSLTGDSHPAWCAKCGAFTDNCEGLPEAT